MTSEIRIDGTVLVEMDGTFTCSWCGNIYRSLEGARPSAHACEMEPEVGGRPAGAHEG